MNQIQSLKGNGQNVEADKIDDRSTPRNKKVWRRKIEKETCLIGQLSKYEQEKQKLEVSTLPQH